MGHILFAMIEVGFGHKGPACAVKQCIEAAFQNPPIHTAEVLDFPSAVGASRTDKTVKDAWNMALKHPWMVRAAYRFMEWIYPYHTAVLQLTMPDFFRWGSAYLVQNPPDLFVATHPMCLAVAVRARKRFSLSFPIIAHVVDPFDGYSLWAEKHADLFLVHSEESRWALRRHGIPSEKIRQVPYPRLPAMNPPSRSREELRRQYGVGSNGKPVVLVTSGAQGIGRVFSFVQRSFLQGDPIDYVVITARNTKLYAELQQIAQQGRVPGKLIPLPLVDSMTDLYALCDVVTGKAGAATCMEALYHKRPFICTEWAAQNDYSIVQFLISQRTGAFTPSFESFRKQLLETTNFNLFSLDIDTHAIMRILVDYMESSHAIHRSL
ncbi:MAG: glycosyltransferase [Termitinemataceae bacterium]